MPTDAEVEAAAEAIARHDIDETTLANVGGKLLLRMIGDQDSASFLARVRAGLAAAEAVRRPIDSENPAADRPPSPSEAPPV